MADVIRALAGDDLVRSGGGNDRVWGDAGNDTLNARDTAKDTVRCGPGKDVANVDKRDKVAADCERVVRR